jgi:hypothetical protein
VKENNKLMRTSFDIVLRKMTEVLQQYFNLSAIRQTKFSGRKWSAFPQACSSKYFTISTLKPYTPSYPSAQAIETASTTIPDF